ncbi:bacteriocin-like protein [Chryseobacterium sp. DT-3]|uniref:bacteriocin-like protein n=1 Tax=Chryseobacterium sp. DT-3 TaxID=3396164 RepID=UPI003F1C4472
MKNFKKLDRKELKAISGNGIFDNIGGVIGGLGGVVGGVGTIVGGVVGSVGGAVNATGQLVGTTLCNVQCVINGVVHIQVLSCGSTC